VRRCIDKNGNAEPSVAFGLDLDAI